MAAMVRVPLMHTGGTVDFLPGSKRHKQTGGFEAVAATSAPARILGVGLPAAGNRQGA
jgi:hypothetical protein